MNTDNEITPKRSTPKMLVTGGTGLVGAHLLAKLVLLGKEIRATYRSKESVKKAAHVFSYYSKDKAFFDNIEWVVADVTDFPAMRSAFKGITHVYHCAAVVSFRKKDDTLMRQINIDGTANMVNLALHNKVAKFCFVSSIASLDKGISTKPIDETNEWNPEADNYGYAISKYGGEMEVWRGSQEGLDVVIVNPGVILGAGFWGTNTGKFFTNASKSFAYYTTGKTGFVGVRDVVKAMLYLMDTKVVNQRYVLVSENVSFQEVMTQMAQTLGTKPPYKKVSPLMASIAWRLAWVASKLTGKQPLITKHSSKAAQRSYEYSSQKIKDTGFEFETISTTIKRTGTLFLEDKT